MTEIGIPYIHHKSANFMEGKITDVEGLLYYSECRETCGMVLNKMV
jgi:hypothetical protein